MSRAFVKEDGPDNEPLPDLPISPHPNYVTPRGFRLLQEKLAATLADLATLKARAERLNLMPERAAERDLRYLEARLRTAILIDPAGQPHDEMTFGGEARVMDDAGREHVFHIVGEDEADAQSGLIGPNAPLARALLGARVGDVVEWRKPSGVTELEVLAITYPQDKT